MALHQSGCGVGEDPGLHAEINDMLVKQTRILLCSPGMTAISLE
jgi:hypothetical protein